MNDNDLLESSTLANMMGDNTIDGLLEGVAFSLKFAYNLLSAFDGSKVKYVNKHGDTINEMRFDNMHRDLPYLVHIAYMLIRFDSAGLIDIHSTTTSLKIYRNKTTNGLFRFVLCEEDGSILFDILYGKDKKFMFRSFTMIESNEEPIIFQTAYDISSAEAVRFRNLCIDKLDHDMKNISHENPIELF